MDILLVAGNSRRLWPTASPRQGGTADSQKLSSDPRPYCKHSIMCVVCYDAHFFQLLIDYHILVGFLFCRAEVLQPSGLMLSEGWFTVGLNSNL